MANQNPQPEVYYTRHAFTTGSSQGSTDTQTVFTNQANNEEVRIYGVQVHLITTALGTDVGVADNDMKLSIQVGNAKVPSQSFDIGVIHQKDDKTLHFPTPILVMFQQPISVTVTWTDDQSPTANTTAVVQLLSELSIQQTEGQYPHSQGGVA
jgi:lipopolysaccharide export system protein LptC